MNSDSPDKAPVKQDSDFRKKARFWIDVVAVIRVNGWLLLGAIAAAYYILSIQTENLPGFLDRATFFTTLAVILTALAGLYILLVAVPYFWFLLTHYILRRDRNQILFKFPKESCILGEDFPVDAILQRKMSLLFGALKFRLVFFNYDATDWYYLLKNQTRRGQVFHSTDKGAIAAFTMRFKHLGRFRTRYSVVKFEDPLGLFSLPLIEKEYDDADAEKNFYIFSLPPTPPEGTAPYYVRKNKVASTSEKAYRVTEDYFDYKRYEPTDDSRRILWPVYSRMKQLLVRIPERDSSIESDVDLYVLFYNSFYADDSEYFHSLYDRYVLAVMETVEALLRKRNLVIHVHSDAVQHPPYYDDAGLTPIENLKRKLVCGYWHHRLEPAQYLSAANENRSPDRERILVMNPFIRERLVPSEGLASFSSVFVPDVRLEDETVKKPVRPGLLYVPPRQNGELLSVLNVRLRKKMEINKAALARYGRVGELSAFR